MNHTIAVLAGDGIGPEIMAQALRVLGAVQEHTKHRFTFAEALIGGAAYAACGSHLPDATLALAEIADAVLFGSVGGPVEKQHEKQWKDCERNSLLGLRKALGLNINLRPVTVHPFLAQCSPVRESIIGNGVDILIVRELAGDVYFGEHREEENSAFDAMEYTQEQIEIAVTYAFRAAATRQKKVTVVDKANVLACSRLWRRVAKDIAENYPEITLEFLYVDNAAMQLIKKPSSFDVLVTANLFGDILSDLASVLPGSVGLMPSASLGKRVHLYEPIGGSAPDIAGKGVANPVAMILSCALMLRHSFGMDREATAIETAVRRTLEAGTRTKDIAHAGEATVNTHEMGDAILQQLPPLLIPSPSLV